MCIRDSIEGAQRRREFAPPQEEKAAVVEAAPARTNEYRGRPERKTEELSLIHI